MKVALVLTASSIVADSTVIVSDCAAIIHSLRSTHIVSIQVHWLLHRRSSAIIVVHLVDEECVGSRRDDTPICHFHLELAIFFLNRLRVSFWSLHWSAHSLSLRGLFELLLGRVEVIVHVNVRLVSLARAPTCRKLFNLGHNRVVLLFHAHEAKDEHADLGESEDAPTDEYPERLGIRDILLHVLRINLVVGSPLLLGHPSQYLLRVQIIELVTDCEFAI